MGYRSDVVIYVEETKNVCIDTVVNDIKIIEDYYDESSVGLNSEGNRVLRVRYVDAKWYSEFPIVKYWNDLFDKMDDLDEEEHYNFARIGEDYNDFEQRGDYGYIYLLRDFDIDVDFDEDGALCR